MNLFEDIEAENNKYINVIDALELVTKKINYDVKDIARRLLLDEFNKIARMFKMNDYEKIEIFCSEKEFNGAYSITTEFLKLAISTLGTFEYTDTDTYGNEHEGIKEDWFDFYWLKSDFFNFSSIKKIGVTEKFYNEVIRLDSKKALHDFLIQNIKQEEDNKAREKAKNISIKFFKEVGQFESQQQVNDITNVQEDYRFFLFKKPLLTFHEASCIMTGYDPQYVEQCQNDTNFKQNFSNYLGAKDYIDSCIDAKILRYDSYNHRLIAEEFKQFLANDNTFVDGFNDHLKNEVIDQSFDNRNSIIDQLKIENEELQQKLTSNEDEYINLAIDLKATENTLNRIVAENEKLKAELVEKDKIINQLQEDKKTTDYINNLNKIKQESDKDFKINEQEEKIKQLILVNEQFSNEIFCLKGRISAIAMFNSKQDRIVGEVKKDYLDLTPEQEIPNPRQRNNVLKIISILSEMAGLPPEPFKAFNMMEVHASENGKEIPKKDTIANWLKDARNSN